MDTLQETYEFFKTLSFWLLGVWLLIALAPIILPILMIDNYIKHYSN